MWHAGVLEGGLGGPAGNPPVVAEQEIVFELRTNVPVSGAHIWNHNQSNLTGRGVKDFEILVSVDADLATATFTSVGTFTLDEACGCSTQLAQFVPFEAADVRFIKFDIDSTHSGLINDYVGLSEVRFVRPPVRD